MFWGLGSLLLHFRLRLVKALRRFTSFQAGPNCTRTFLFQFCDGPGQSLDMESSSASMLVWNPDSLMTAVPQGFWFNK